MVNEGAQLIPVNENEKIFKIDQQGVQLGPNQRLILALRHSKGNYDDILDDYGRFTYQPPNNTNGMLRYRWSEYLQKTLQVPFVLIVIIWFEYRVNEKMNHNFILDPTTIVNENENTKDIGISLSYPLNLKIIERSTTYTYLQLLRALDTTKIKTRKRKILDNNLADEWSYSQINNLNTGNKIKNWAKTK
ncbi:MAG: hypothetical protein WCB31_02545 [Nitrososphaeraceae archaeon]